MNTELSKTDSYLLACSGDAEVNLDPDLVAKFSLLILKLNACVNHLEQFPIKVCVVWVRLFKGAFYVDAIF